MTQDGHAPEPQRVAQGPRQPTAYRNGDHDDRSLGDLFRELAGETKLLVRQEIQLARTELTEKASKAGKHAAFIAVGGFVAYAGLIGLMMALGFLLGSFMPNWLGFLAAGIVVLIVGYALFQKGLSGLKHTDFSLERTAETLQEDKLWMKQEVQEVKRDPKHLGSSR